jgi:hypothetical protein
MRTTSLIAAVAAVLTAALPAQAADELSLSAIVVKPQLKAGKPYDVALQYVGDASSVREVCFLWSGEGPFCWRAFKVDKKKMVIRTKARTGNPNTYMLSGFVRYGSGQQTNRVQAPIDVKK